MSKMNNALYQVHYIDCVSRENKMINSIYPVYKLLITIVYIVLLMSIDKYDISRIIMMASYLIIMFIFSEVSFIQSIRKLRYILPILLFVGIFNPIFDQNVYLKLNSFTITTGMISMITLFLKGSFALLSSYLLIITTTIEKICFSLRKLMIPEVIVTQILLTYRYITVLLSQVNTITQAYSLRAPKQKGIHHKVWGSLTGQLLLRSLDSANDIYQSMLLRGYNGNFEFLSIKVKQKDNIYFISIIILLIFLRFNSI